MYNVRFKTYELSAKDVKINLTILLAWIIAMFSFMFGLFFGKGNFAIICMLLMFASMLCSVPVVIIIKSRTKRLQVPKIQDLELTILDHKLYNGNTQLYVYYDKTSELVHLYTTSTSTKGVSVKTQDIIILEEDNLGFLHFCEEHNIPTMHPKNYII